MSLVPHSFFPRSQFDMDRWVSPLKNVHSTLDLFDAFDELDHVRDLDIFYNKIFNYHFIMSCI